jgi:hypothetical protein
LNRIAALLLLALVLPACATITTGTSHNLTVLTEPPGATCELRRGDEVIGVVNPTPGSVRVSKSSRDVAIRCQRTGMADATVTLPSELQAMTVGNLLIGGLIGIAVDIASGAAGSYPNSVTLTLAPTGGNAPNAPQIDALNARMEALRSLCAPAERARCEAELQRLEAERTRLSTPTS